MVDSSMNGLILSEPTSPTIPDYALRTAIAYYDASTRFISEQLINSGHPNPIVVSVPSNAATYKIYIRVTTSAGTLNNLVIKPMLRNGNIIDDSFEPYQEPTDSLIETKDRAYLNSTIGHACKNLLDLTKYRASTDVTDIVIDPKTGSVSANASGSWKTVHFIDENIQFENGKTYVISCKNNVVNTSGSLAIRHRVTNIIYKGASFKTLGVKSITFTPNVTDFPNGWLISLFITNASGASDSIDISELMLKEVSISDDTFEPYQEPTDSLIETKARVYLNSTVGHTCKNLFQITADTKTINGVTFTVDKQAGTVIANGTASKYTVFGLAYFYQERGMILSGCTGGSSRSYWIDTWDGSVQIHNFSGDTNISTQSQTQVRIGIWAGTSVNNVVFKPMIRDGSISDDTFEPY